ncbi:MAG: dihydrodipicolinate synthase family protein [Xanthobacteraceae bacterium]
MPMYQPGLVHTPVTPFTRERGIDFDRYAKLIEFHLASGADALALPMHAGESVSLADGERRALVEFAVKQVDGRKPVIAHVSETAPPSPRRSPATPRNAGPPPSSPPRRIIGRRRPRWCSSISRASARR